MGLLPDNQTIDRLDVETILQVVEYIARAGIGRSALADLKRPHSRDPAQLTATLQHLAEDLLACPAPASEWQVLRTTFGVDHLARLLGISVVSVRRYALGARRTPDDVAARVHFLALAVGDLAGAYNDIGIRRWFERRRALLGDRSPAELLAGAWSPDDPGSKKVWELAEALVASPGT
ncbi:MAG: hypothetical protein HY335_08235 [Deinococcus sp.]|nr:hypothetical protein [Deinococcus sp.]